MPNQKVGPALAAALFATVGFTACSTPTLPSAAPATRQAVVAAGQAPGTLQRMYAAADADHDGRLTREEARWRLPVTYASFDSIDVGKRGYITLAEYLAFHEARATKLTEDVLHLGDEF